MLKVPDYTRSKLGLPMEDWAENQELLCHACADYERTDPATGTVGCRGCGPGGDLKRFRPRESEHMHQEQAA